MRESLYAGLAFALLAAELLVLALTW